MTTLRTVARSLRHEPPKIKGSRFIASVEHAASAEAARAFVEAVAEEFRDASHHCFAWRLGIDENAWRASDAGEPSGTAGKPILQQIDSRRLTDVAVVVTRYFGGTKLGTGGLIRAYGGAASAALELAGVVEVPLTEPLRLTFDYELTGPVQGVLAAFDLAPTRAGYGAAVEMELAVPVADARRLRQSLTDATQGRIGIG